VVTSVSDPIEESDVSITVESDASEGLAIVRVVGDVDLWSVDDLRKELGQVQPTVSNLIVDLTGVSFIDSTGIGVLVSSSRTCGRQVVAWGSLSPNHTFIAYCK